MGLNPFRAGQCLSTNDNRSLLTKIAESQSLSSRAMSFDDSDGNQIGSVV